MKKTFAVFVSVMLAVLSVPTFAQGGTVMAAGAPARSADGKPVVFNGAGDPGLIAVTPSTGPSPK